MVIYLMKNPHIQNLLRILKRCRLTLPTVRTSNQGERYTEREYVDPYTGDLVCREITIETIA